MGSFRSVRSTVSISFSAPRCSPTRRTRSGGSSAEQDVERCSFFRLLRRVVARMFIGFDLCSLPLLQFQLSDESAEVGAAGRADAPASTASLDRVSPDREIR